MKWKIVRQLSSVRCEKLEKASRVSSWIVSRIIEQLPRLDDIAKWAAKVIPINFLIISIKLSRSKQIIIISLNSIKMQTEWRIERILT